MNEQQTLTEHDLGLDVEYPGSVPFDPSAPLTRSGRLKRRQAISRVVEAAESASALLAVGVLGILVFSVADRGLSVLSLDFLTSNPPRFSGTPGGGIAPEIVGTLLLMGMATAVAMPTGVLVALYLTEFASPRPARLVKLGLDILNGLPSIVIGLFIFGLLVVGHGQTGLAGSLALAIIMLPVIARSAQEILLLVPQSLRDASSALGVSRWRAVRGVILPSALGGILTGTVLAVARAAGETAPLIFASSIFGNQVSFDFFGSASPNIPVYIFTVSESADQYGFARAWGAALVLLGSILIASLGARALLNRSRSKLVS